MNIVAKVVVPVAAASAIGYGTLVTFGGGTPANPFCGGDAHRCWFGDCKIPVENVTCGTPGSGNYGSMKVQEEFSVCKRQRMVWEIDDHSLSFNDNGIALKSSNSDFDPTDRDHKDWRFTWIDRHNNVGVKIEYAVTVQKSGTDCAHLDPRIYNE